MDGSIDRVFEKGALDQIRFCRGLCTWCTFTLVHRATKRSGLLIWARRCESVLIFGLGSLSCICIACGSFAASWISMNFMRFLEDPHMDLSSRATSRIFCILQRSDLQGKQDWFMRLVERWVLGKHWKTLEDTGNLSKFIICSQGSPQSDKPSPAGSRFHCDTFELRLLPLSTARVSKLWNATIYRAMSISHVKLWWL